MKFAIEEYTWIEVMKVVVILGISGTAYLIPGEKGLLLYGLMMVGLKYVNMQRVFAVGAGALHGSLPKSYDYVPVPYAGYGISRGCQAGIGTYFQIESWVSSSKCLTNIISGIGNFYYLPVGR